MPRMGGKIGIGRVSVLRGPWGYVADYAHCAYRYFVIPNHHYVNRGFRCGCHSSGCGLLETLKKNE
jgi:hypothetical protein